MSSLEGIRRPPPMGAVYEYSTLRHIAELRNEAIKRYNSIKVEQMPLSYSGYFSKNVFKIQQGLEQIQRAINSTGGATEICLVLNGKLITIHVDNYLVIHVEPLSLPHRHVVSPYINTLLTQPAKGVGPTASAPASNIQREAPPKAKPQPAKKKTTSTDHLYVPTKRVTVENKDYNTKEKAHANHFKRIQLTKIKDKQV